MTDDELKTPTTPLPTPNPWSDITKLAVGLTLIAIGFWFLYSFQNLITPLLLTFLLSFLLLPLIRVIRRVTRLPYQLVVNLVFLVIVALLVGGFTAVGVVIFQQVVALIELVEGVIVDLPQIIENLSSMTIEPIDVFGFFVIDPAQLIPNVELIDLQAVANQVIDLVQPVVGGAGSLVGSLAGATAATFTWGFFIFLISYFFLLGLPERGMEPSRTSLPGLSEDLDMLVQRTMGIWRNYVGGQLVLVIVSGTTAWILMSMLGVRFALGIGVMAGLARFIPYIGTPITLTVTFIATILQSSNPFALDPLAFSLLAVGIEAVLDAVIDNGVMPQLFGRVLGVHPAAVLIAAVVLASLIGFLGLLLAAPIVATAQLVGRFAVFKLFDLDPWAETEAPQDARTTVKASWWGGALSRAKHWVVAQWMRMRGTADDAAGDADRSDEDADTGDTR